MTPFGDRAVRFPLAADAPRRELLDELRALPGVGDVVLTEDVGCVVFDAAADARVVTAAVTGALAASRRPGPRAAEPATHVIRVVYDGEDLDDVARTIGRTRGATIALHAERAYRVAMLGFLPGFGYLRGGAEELALPRRTPRPRVPPGSVAIAAHYTSIYPYPSAGGWHLLGRALGFSAFSEGRATLAIGDVVHFVPKAAPPPDQEAPARSRAAVTASPTRPHLELTRIAGVALLVDGGRAGRMHEGVPPGGPLVPPRLRRANALAGNSAGACAVELTGKLEVVARGGRVTIADDRACVDLAEGEGRVVSSGAGARVAYLAVAGGGVEAPVILGGRGALLAAGIGRLLARGDRLVPQRLGDARLDADAGAGATEPPLDGPIVVVPGPDEVAGCAIEAIARMPLSVSPASNRTGTRLDGWSPPHAVRGSPAMARPSRPMVKGAIELTPSGLVVLGPDHPTTGGYPVVAVVCSTSLDALFARPLGAAVELAIAR